ncbi:hypothetical protein [Cellulosilyticum ruminicola]|uniref:hypothetical protein n=1 Tax=Cellulosilyticum ruminicola TaxID=425254 RepID=UPI0006D236FE|nr:hypothetical protein [Cellulosilyticum ruminicola]
MNEDRLSYRVQGESEATTHKLQQSEAYLKGLIESIGYGIYKSEYEVEGKIDHNTPINVMKKGESAFEEIV